MPVLLFTHERFHDHDTGPHHPERPSRLAAVRLGVERSGVADALVAMVPRAATAAEVERVHTAQYVARLHAACLDGGGLLDPDTPVVPASWEAALLAAGAGLDAIERLEAGEADAAFCAVRPPGHHALPSRGMGFCLLNNVAVAAAALADRGERVVIVDFDAHHGNGTQEVFYADGRVLFISLHQWPLYPGTGALRETGSGAGAGATINFPMPAHATGEHYRRAVERVIAPAVERFEATWMLISAGFDGHVSDPITDLGLSSADFADITADLVQLVGPGRTVAFLEGGYDLEGLANSVAGCLSALAGERTHPERPTSGGPGASVVDAVEDLRAQA